MGLKKETGVTCDSTANERGCVSTSAGTEELFAELTQIRAFTLFRVFRLHGLRTLSLFTSLFSLQLQVSCTNCDFKLCVHPQLIFLPHFQCEKACRRVKATASDLKCCVLRGNAMPWSQPASYSCGVAVILVAQLRGGRISAITESNHTW